MYAHPRTWTPTHLHAHKTRMSARTHKYKITKHSLVKETMKNSKVKSRNYYFIFWYLLLGVLVTISTHTLITEKWEIRQTQFLLWGFVSPNMLIKHTCTQVGRSPVVKNTCCSYRDPGVSSQNPQGSSWSVILVPGDPMPLLSSMGTRLPHGAHTYMQYKYSYI